jgi:hypothetical protein
MYNKPEFIRHIVALNTDIGKVNEKIKLKQKFAQKN